VFAFPSDKTIRDQWFHALGQYLSPDQKKQIDEHPRNFKLAHWHFDPNHRSFDVGTKKWSFLQQTTYKDRDNKVWKTPNFPPPNASLEQYKMDIEEKNWKRPGAPHYCSERNLPDWVDTMIRIERANRKPPPVPMPDPPEGKEPSKRSIESMELDKKNAKKAGHALKKSQSLRARVAGLEKENKRGEEERHRLEVSSEKQKRKHEKLEKSMELDKKKARKHTGIVFQKSQSLAEANAGLRARVAELEKENKRGKEERLQLEVSFEKQKSELKKLEERLRVFEKEKIELKTSVECLESQLQGHGRFLTYDDLREGGLLAKSVKEFTFFATVECNDEFLKVLNFTDDDYDGTLKDGDGLCQNYFRYSTYSIAQRETDQQEPTDTNKSSSTVHRPESTNTTTSSSGHATSTDDATATSLQKRQRQAGGRNHKLDYKTEWLVYNLYIHAGWTELQIAPLVGAGYGTIYNIIYFWANLLNDVLSAWFPRVSRSQMLRAYPEAMLRKHGHCRIGPILDATEQFTQDTSRLKVHACLFSAYKNHTTVKFLAGCDGIGVTWADVLPDGYPGAISDPVLTALTEILKRAPFGTYVQVDKGFLIDNDGIILGIITSRPMKMLKNQTQQSAEDTAGTQKVAHTRIPIEQLNGGAKGSARWLQKVIPITQISLLNLVMRTCFLMQNFHPGFVKGREYTPDEGRPSRAEVRFYGRPKRVFSMLDRIQSYGRHGQR
jgi:hypothetical protein